MRGNFPAGVNKKILLAKIAAKSILSNQSINVFTNKMLSFGLSQLTGDLTKTQKACFNWKIHETCLGYTHQLPEIRID